MSDYDNEHLLLDLDTFSESMRRGGNPTLSALAANASARISTAEATVEELRARELTYERAVDKLVTYNQLQAKAINRLKVRLSTFVSDEEIDKMLEGLRCPTSGDGTRS